MTTTYLYRARDEAGKLLYIGITENRAARQATHAAIAPWRGLSAPDLEWVDFPTRADALKAESEEIALHRPPFNIAGNPDKRRDLVDPVRVNLQVSRATRTSWRLSALERGVSLAELIDQAMAAVLSGMPPEHKGESA